MINITIAWAFCLLRLRHIRQQTSKKTVEVCIKDDVDILTKGYIPVGVVVIDRKSLPSEFAICIAQEAEAIRPMDDPLNDETPRGLNWSPS